MRPKAVALLAFIQITILTISIEAISFCLQEAQSIIVNARLYYYYELIKIPFMFKFYLAIQEHAIGLYLIPLIWFIFTLRAVYLAGTSPYFERLAFWSGIFIMIIFILVTVDAAYLPKYVCYYNGPNWPCWPCCGNDNFKESFVFQFWDYLNKQIGN